ncbi:hypothetical protein QC761_512170 [Podospora bellae-mahoneyi]|uniref:Uncharacterized protein n=1 Tax=Podospora bellae-mahoneyi TaxID=2093777 RepID=A0ABR0FGU8_9PEZI|nr:hypothetical protein QC761_512170 [Podospora bellae-mahoneyi]
MLTKTFFAVGALLIQLVHGAAEPPVFSYSVVKVKWSLPVDPNKPNGARDFVTGTIEEAIAQMDATHPGWSQTFTSNIQTVDLHALMARGSSPRASLPTATWTVEKELPTVSTSVMASVTLDPLTALPPIAPLAAAAVLAALTTPLFGGAMTMTPSRKLPGRILRAAPGFSRTTACTTREEPRRFPPRSS